MGVGDYIGAPVKALGAGTGKLGSGAESAWDWAVTGMSGGEGYVPQGYGYDESLYGDLRGQEGQSREFENYLAQQYRDQIEGRFPSLAQRQLAETTAQNQQQQLSMARSGSGPLGGAGAQYQAARNAAETNQMANRQAATLRAQEQQMAMQGASGLAGQRRGADLARLAAEQEYQLGKAGVHTSLEQAKAQQAEAEAQRRAGASMFGVGAVAGAAGSLLGSSDERMKTAPSAAGPNVAPAAAVNPAAVPAPAPAAPAFDPEAELARVREMQQGIYRDSAGKPYAGRWDWVPDATPPATAPQMPAAGSGNPYSQGKGAGGLLGGILGGLSDRGAKCGPQPVEGEDLDAFLEDLEGYRYRYRHGTGEDPNRDRVGVMAQDLERDPVGSTFVTDASDGYKRIELDKGFGTALAALGRLNERVNSLERGRR